MSKISYSADSLRRRMLMAKTASLLLMVEGRENDKWYYDQLAASALSGLRKRWLVWDVDQFTRNWPDGQRCGKTAVLALFDDARRNGNLRISSRGNSCAVLFCVDADLDRLVGGMKRSRHLYYTNLADSEAEVLSQSSISKTIAALLSLSKADADALVLNLGEFEENLGKSLLSNIALHCAARIAKSRYVPPLPSATDLDTMQPPCSGKSYLEGQRRKALDASPLNANEFALIEKHLILRLSRLVGEGRAGYFIKGKWTLQHLNYLINHHLVSQGRRKIRGRSSLSATMRACTIVSRAHSRRFVSKVNQLVA